MKKLLGFAVGTSFLWVALFAENAAADNKKVCVRVVEHTPQSTSSNEETEKKEQKKANPGKETLQKTESEEAAKAEESVSETDDGNQVGAEPTSSAASTRGASSGIGPKPPANPGRSAKPVVTDGEHPWQSPSSARQNTKSTAKVTFPVDPPITWRDKSENTNIPIGQTALVYLERLLEHFVTHQPGHVAAEKGCDETLGVELYPLQRGWTAFARYSGTGREERVDQLFPSELSMFAERSVVALLEDVPISATINRENVLKSDSMKSVQRVKGRSHFILSVGAQFRVGQLPTWKESASSPAVDDELRLLFPVKFSIGYRGRFESWGLEAIANLGLGTNSQVGKGATGSNINSNAGHVDYGGDTGIALHFLRYFDPRGLTSFYLGSGATFEMLWFRIIEDRGTDKSTLFSGGLNVDGVIGWEFMRASAAQFFLQGEINVPAYFIRSANDEASLKTWLPGVTVKIGVVF